MEEPSGEANNLTHEVIGAALEVHRILGPGFLESVYESALCVELALRNLPFERQKEITLEYKGKQVGVHRLDLLVSGMLVVELKAADHRQPLFRAQVISYLKASGCKLGLLINFNASILREGIERVILS